MQLERARAGAAAAAAGIDLEPPRLGSESASATAAPRAPRGAGVTGDDRVAELRFVLAGRSVTVEAKFGDRLGPVFVAFASAPAAAVPAGAVLSFRTAGVAMDRAMRVGDYFDALAHRPALCLVRGRVYAMAVDVTVGPPQAPESAGESLFISFLRRRLRRH